MAEVEPAGTVIEAATGRAVLLLDKDTTVPPLGAACARATVQVELAPEVRLVGAHCSEDRVGCQFRTVMAPAVAEMASGAPMAKPAEVLVTAMGTVEPPGVGERVNVTVAVTPSPIVESFIPTVAHITEPLAV